MTLTAAATIALPILLLVVLHTSGRNLRWLGRPWFITGQPSRTALTITLTVITIIAIVHAIT